VDSPQFDHVRGVEQPSQKGQRALGGIALARAWFTAFGKVSGVTWSLARLTLIRSASAGAISPFAAASDVTSNQA
jgi:hypothetical protein